MITRTDLNTARRVLGISAPVELRITRYRDDTCGRLIANRDGTWIVGLDTYLSRQASLTLWHELVHIAQAERVGGVKNFEEMVLEEAVAGRLVGPRERRWFWSRAYRRMPHEREAERLGRRQYRCIRLATTRT